MSGPESGLVVAQYCTRRPRSPGTGTRELNPHNQPSRWVKPWTSLQHWGLQGARLPQGGEQPPHSGEKRASPTTRHPTGKAWETPQTNLGSSFTPHSGIHQGPSAPAQHPSPPQSGHLRAQEHPSLHVNEQASGCLHPLLPDTPGASRGPSSGTHTVLSAVKWGCGAPPGTVVSAAALCPAALA